MTIIWLLIGVLVIWIGVITFFFFKMRNHYHALTDGVDKKTLEGVLTKMVNDVHDAKKGLAALTARCDTIEEQQIFNIQKIGLLRFNPFKDTGGDQSFILALLDAHDTGVVITALYSRSGTRWYAKKVIAGKGSGHELSEEEKQAITMANKSK